MSQAQDKKRSCSAKLERWGKGLVVGRMLVYQGISLWCCARSEENRLSKVGVEPWLTCQNQTTASPRKSGLGTRIHAGSSGVEISIELLGQLLDSWLVPKLDGRREREGRKGPERALREQENNSAGSATYWKPCGCFTVSSDTSPLIAEESLRITVFTRCRSVNARELRLQRAPHLLQRPSLEAIVNLQQGVNHRSPRLKQFLCAAAVAQAHSHGAGSNTRAEAAGFQEASGGGFLSSGGERIAVDSLHNGLKHPHCARQRLTGGRGVRGVEGHEVVHVVDDGGDVVGGQTAWLVRLIEERWCETGRREEGCAACKSGVLMDGCWREIMRGLG
jgi:hypothetical protein